MSEDSEESKPVSKTFTAYDVQRYRLEKLMENPDKPVVIPPRQDSKSKKSREAPEFVRNVMGSSAGAGSGEFHVYRHLRRKEFARQRMIEEDARREELDSAYQERLDRNRKEAEARVEKNRLKRLKKKQKMKGKKKAKTSSEPKTTDEDSDSDDNGGNGDKLERADGTGESNADPQDQEKPQRDEKQAEVKPD